MFILMMKSLNLIEPMMEYALSTYILVLPTFVITQFHFSPTVAFIIASIPFSGRILGALIYQYLVRAIGSRITVITSLIFLGIFSAFDGITSNVQFLAISRFLIGVFFGISTSIAVSKAIMSRSRMATGLTMGGWAIGWIGGSIAYFVLRLWEFIAISGLITIPLAFTIKTDFRQREIRYQFPPILSILVYFLSFEPSFALTLAPYILEQLGENVMLFMVTSYLLSLPFYLFGYKLDRYFEYMLMIVALSAFLFFYLKVPEALLVFTALGLGINSISPIIAQRYGANALNSGIAVNIAAIGGTIIPVVFSQNVKDIAFFILFSMLTLFVMNKESKKEEKIAI